VNAEPLNIRLSILGGRWPEIDNMKFLVPMEDLLVHVSWDNLIGIGSESLKGSLRKLPPSSKYQYVAGLYS
jgi:hypothetical protein